MGRIACTKDHWHARRGSLLLAVLLSAGVLLFACGQPRGTAAPTRAASTSGAAIAVGAMPPPSPRLGWTEITPAPTPGGPRTPPPTVVLDPTKLRPPGTAMPFEKPPPASWTAMPYETPGPEDPYCMTVRVARAPNIRLSAYVSTTVAIGTITRVEPARWNTPGGRRPPNPHDRTQGYAIFTPVLLEVERYLKGPLPQQRLPILAPGGTVGQDCARRSDSLFVFTEGERVVLFLEQQDRASQASDGQPYSSPLDRYSLTVDGSATNAYHTVPLQQLLDEMAAAQQWP